MIQYKKFLACMIYLQKLFAKELSDEVVAIYWERLKTFPDIDFEMAMKDIVDTFIPTSTVPFPMIAHFIQSTGLSNEGRAHAAVVMVKRYAESCGSYKSVNFGDRALHSTINRFGGWTIIARWGEEWQYQEKNFMEAYKSALEYDPNDGPSHCEGIFEIENYKKNLSAEQQKIADRVGKPIEIKWRGFKNLLEDKNKKPELLIENDIIKTLAKKMSV